MHTLTDLRQGMEFYKGRRQSPEAPDQWFLVWISKWWKVTGNVEPNEEWGRPIIFATSSLAIQQRDGDWQSVAIFIVAIQNWKSKINKYYMNST